MTIRWNLKACLLAAAVLLGPAAHAVIIESGDAGDTLATSQSAILGGNTTPSSIFGSLDKTDPTDPFGGDADVFGIYLTDPGSFGARVFGNGGTPLVDSALFLFDAAGRGVAARDMGANSGDLQAQLFGDASWAPGQYFLAIAFGFSFPVDEFGIDIFDFDFGTDDYVAGTGDSLAGWFFGSPTDQETNGYRIDLYQVPEPATFALLGLGLAGIAALRRRRAR